MTSHIQQSGLKSANTRLTGRKPEYSKSSSSECVVIAVRYIDDDLNISKTHVEYDVRDLRTGDIYPNCRRGDQAAGMLNGEENILHAATKIIGATDPSFDPRVDPLTQSDGDFVIVDFTYGARHGSVIVAVLPHEQMTYGTKREFGERRYLLHQGTSLTIGSDGSYSIVRGDTSIVVDKDSNITVTHKTGSQLRFLDNGDVDVVPNGNLLLGSSRALAPMARVDDEVTCTIPSGMVMVPNPDPAGPPEIPNPEPIPLTGLIITGSANVKG